MARYGQKFKTRTVARLLPPESAPITTVSAESGVSVATWSAGVRMHCPCPLESQWHLLKHSNARHETDFSGELERVGYPTKDTI